ncbi:MAG TPA: TRAP transporter large permease subunit [Candidatus Limnocylindria bacterium]|nr:TRAP transporter large permease subunit [Candidatus Limnocylindria bacterium]
MSVLFTAVAGGFAVYLFYYYWTGAGGPTQLAVALVPVTFVVAALDALRTGGLYPRLGRPANVAVTAVYSAAALAVAVYFTVEFVEIRTVRAGFWSTTDLLVGAVMVLLVMEYGRLRYFPLFVINGLLILYTVYGWLVPGMFGHPGLEWSRVVTAMTVETTTGVFSRLPQLALTLIGSFLLVLSLLRAFGCVDSILRAASRIAARSPHALPQSAVLGSFGVAAISGSGAANAATTGSATIPAMIAAGLSRERAAAIETASSLGGQLMPPVMGISAFLMADFLGVSYFDVVARGYAPALVYFAGVAAAVYLMTARLPVRAVAIAIERLTMMDRVNIVAYAAVVLGLIYLMGIVHMPAMEAAQQVFMLVGIALVVVFIAVTVRGAAGWRDLGRRSRDFVETFTLMTTDLTLLLATLSIMTGVFVITGVPTKLGFVLMQAATIHLAAMLLVAFAFGTLLGTGLPPAPTYIITALVIAPFLVKAGIDPWVVHFYAFFIAVWGELTPPTSVVAAVAAKIAGASFMATMMAAMRVCLPLFVLMGAVFTRPELVVQPGAAQLGAFALVLTGTVGLVFALQGRFADGRGADLLIRTVLAAAALVTLAHRDDMVAGVATLLTAGLVGYWVFRARNRLAVYREAGAPAG